LSFLRKLSSRIDFLAMSWLKLGILEHSCKD
jgi:hypothetical protein